MISREEMNSAYIRLAEIIISAIAFAPNTEALEKTFNTFWKIHDLLDDELVGYVKED